METKTCSKCKIEQDISEFSVREDGKDGFRNQCNQCRKEMSKEYREINKEKCKLSNRRWHEKHPEYRKEHDKAYYENNKKIILVKVKEYSIYHKKEKKDYDKEYYIKNKEKIINGKRLYSFKRNREDLRFRLKKMYLV